MERKERDQIQQLEDITREITRTDQLFRQSSEQLQTLQYVEEENKLVRQQEKTLKSEITLLRSKLANCETELLQCKNKIRLLMDDIQIEQSSFKYKDQFEINLLHEVERIQNEIDMAVRSAESTSKISDTLKNEVIVIEKAIAEKKQQLEKLINEMKEANLQSLTVTTTEEIRNLLEGQYKNNVLKRNKNKLINLYSFTSSIQDRIGQAAQGVLWVLQDNWKRQYQHPKIRMVHIKLCFFHHRNVFLK